MINPRSLKVAERKNENENNREARNVRERLRGVITGTLDVSLGARELHRDIVKRARCRGAVVSHRDGNSRENGTKWNTLRGKRDRG